MLRNKNGSGKYIMKNVPDNLNAEYGKVSLWINRIFFITLTIIFAIFILRLLIHSEYKEAIKEFYAIDINSLNTISAEEADILHDKNESYKYIREILFSIPYKLLNCSIILFASASALSFTVLIRLFIKRKEYKGALVTLFIILAILFAALRNYIY